MNYIESDSRKIYYRSSGENNSRTIIFVHGLAADSRFFHNQLKYFGNDYRVIAIDLPGHGRSRKNGELSAELYSRSIEQVVKRERIDSYILAGHSMGGAVSLEHYKHHRDKIEALILISTAPKLPVTQDMVDRSIEDINGFFDEILSLIFVKKAGIFILAAKKSIAEEEKLAVTDDLKICIGMDYSSILESIDKPVLILANRHDRMVPAEMTIQMHEKISNSKLVLFDHNGHIPFFEESEEFNASVSEFIESLQ